MVGEPEHGPAADPRESRGDARARAGAEGFRRPGPPKIKVREMKLFSQENQTYASEAQNNRPNTIRSQMYSWKQRPNGSGEGYRRPGAPKIKVRGMGRISQERRPYASAAWNDRRSGEFRRKKRRKRRSEYDAFATVRLVTASQSVRKPERAGEFARESASQLERARNS